jgi:uncharacterized cupin superfamily protein
MPEAHINETEHGRVPADDGWFVVNLRDTPAMRHEEFGSGIIFEAAPGQFPHFGINVRWLEPGDPASVYHAESAQEAFLVLLGEAMLVIEDAERKLVQWDFVHLPPDTPHALVGGGEQPCAVLMVGARRGDEDRITFPRSETAAGYGASVSVSTDSRVEAYADRSGDLEPRPSFWPPAD